MAGDVVTHETAQQRRRRHKADPYRAQILAPKVEMPKLEPLVVPDCDAPAGLASVYMGRDGKYICRCIVCARCGRHTGNSHQGHHWSHCNVTRQVEKPHFCCPDDCELQAAKEEL